VVAGNSLKPCIPMIQRDSGDLSVGGCSAEWDDVVAKRPTFFPTRGRKGVKDLLRGYVGKVRVAGGRLDGRMPKNAAHFGERDAVLE
jgi:hypothetical protein